MSFAVQPLLRSLLAVGLATLLLALSHAATLPTMTPATICKLRGSVLPPAATPTSPFCRTH